MEAKPFSELPVLNFTPVKIVMSVELISFNSTFNLELIARKTINSNYQKNRFAACIVRCKHGVGMFYSSGELLMNLNGLEQREACLALYTGILQKIDSAIRIVDRKTVTLTATSNCGRELYLNALHQHCLKRKHAENVSFAPQLFPGISLNIPVAGNDKIKVNVFNSGKFVITGCTTTAQVVEVYEKMKQRLPQYVKN